MAKPEARNYYHCSWCARRWSSDGDAGEADRCPSCGTSDTPEHSEDLGKAPSGEPGGKVIFD